MAKELVKEYGLPEDPVRETNLNRFMWHIGRLKLTNGSTSLTYLVIQVSDFICIAQ